MCTRIWVRSMIGLFKMSLSICQSGQKEIQNVVPIIVWVQYWPRTRILVLLCRRCLLGLDYICSTHYTQQQKCWNTVMRRGTFSEQNLDSLPTLPPPPPNLPFFCCFLQAIFSAKCRPWDKGGHSFSPLEKGGLVSKHFFLKLKTLQSRRLLKGLIKQHETEFSCDISTGQYQSSSGLLRYLRLV